MRPRPASMPTEQKLLIPALSRPRAPTPQDSYLDPGYKGLRKLERAEWSTCQGALETPGLSQPAARLHGWFAQSWSRRLSRNRAGRAPGFQGPRCPAAEGLHLTAEPPAVDGKPQEHQQAVARLPRQTEFCLPAPLLSGGGGATLPSERPLGTDPLLFSGALGSQAERQRPFMCQTGPLSRACKSA